MLEQYQRVYATVDLDAVRANMEQMRGNISPDTKIMAVLKADGYGHGAVPVGRELETLDYVAGYATATPEEGMILRAAGLKKPILVLGYTFPYSYEEMIKNDIRITVFCEDMLAEISECADKLGIRAKIHIKVDTGMGRIGIFPDDKGFAFVKKALSYEKIEVEGLFTHFAKADETDKTYTEIQFDRFSQFCGRIETELGYRIPVRHCSNSAAIIDLKKMNMNMVRAGIALYGLWPSEEVHRDRISLSPALTLKSRIIYCKEIEKGMSISYGGIFTAPRKMRIATVPVGYADGYARGLSNKGYVLVYGKRAPIIGRICMDQFMIDIDDIPQAKAGTEVTLIGKDGPEQITLEELGALSGRFHYEFVCNLGKRIPRVYLKEGRILCTKDYYKDFG
ncbi:MAG: alanine racemase [Ruminococcus sp.]|nr:alanine racemase [Ruminococcus sp.]